MKNIRTQIPRRLLAIAVIATLAACASAPPRNQNLDEARAAYDRAAADANVARSATVELQRSQQALQKADAAMRASEEVVVVDHLALIAKQRVQVALEAAKIAAADKAVGDAQAQRDKLIIASRTREAELQTANAEQARKEAEVARMAAEMSRDEANASRKLAEQRLASASAAREQADAQRKAADEARLAAETARMAADDSRKATEAEMLRAKALEAELAALKAKKTDRGMVLTLGDVLFDSGKSTLKAGALRTVDQLAQFLEKNPGRKVLIEGHTDSVGGAEYNRDLSKSRAAAVQTALTEKKITSDRVNIAGLGEDFPVANNETTAGRQQNRRVEVIFSDETGSVKARAPK